MAQLTPNPLFLSFSSWVLCTRGSWYFYISLNYSNALFAFLLPAVPSYISLGSFLDIQELVGESMDSRCPCHSPIVSGPFMVPLHLRLPPGDHSPSSHQDTGRRWVTWWAETPSATLPKYLLGALRGHRIQQGKRKCFPLTASNQCCTLNASAPLKTDRCFVASVLEIQK